LRPFYSDGLFGSAEFKKIAEYFIVLVDAEPWFLSSDSESRVFCWSGENSHFLSSFSPHLHPLSAAFHSYFSLLFIQLFICLMESTAPFFW
jgi:hypothetical protein